MPELALPTGHVLRQFIEDHARIREFLDRLLETGEVGPSPGEAGALLTDLRLAAHHETLEEDVLFPLLRDRGVRDVPNLFVAEHGLLRHLRQRVATDLARSASGLKQRVPSEPHARARTYAARYKKHLADEERTVYKAAMNLRNDVEFWAQVNVARIERLDWRHAT